MTQSPTQRRGLRLSRPDQEQFFTVMVVFSHRTFRWTMARKMLIRVSGIVLGIWALAMIGSAYGFWATKRIMSFSHLQQETAEQERQLRESLNQAQGLEGEITTLRKQVTDLLTLLNPKAPGSDLSPVPSQGVVPPQSPEDAKVSKLREDLDRSSVQAKLIRARMEPLINRWNHTPSIPPTAGYFSSGFGIRISPFSRANEAGDGLLGFHSGIDISNADGTPIQATADGLVESAGWMEGYGWTVLVRHSNELETLYAHHSRLNVKAGQKVLRGDILGFMGRSGTATGVHLHYEVRRNGRAVNPTPYMRLQREWLSSFR